MPKAYPQQDRSVKDIAWLAGLMEGEGSFCASPGTIVMQLCMTDQDIVTRSANLVKAPSVREEKREAPLKNPWRWSISGNKAAGWMMTLYPLMGKRRQEQIRATLSVWRSKPVSRRMWS